MNILDNANRSWEAFLAATSSVALPVVSAVHQRDSSGCLTVLAERSIVHSTTPTTIVTAPTTGSRVIVGLTVLNADSSSADITIRYNDSGSIANLYSVTLESLDILQFSPQEGFHVTDKLGQTRVNQTSASFASTASYVAGANVDGTVESSSFSITSSFSEDAESASFATRANFTNIGATGSFTGSQIDVVGLTGSLRGTADTASYVAGSDVDGAVALADTASYVAGGNVDGAVASATSASHALQADNAQTADSATSASFATRANFTNIGATGSFTGSQVIATSITGTLFGTSSWANNVISASHAIKADTASFVTASGVVGTVTSASHAITASFAENADGGAVGPISFSRGGTIFDPAGITAASDIIVWRAPFSCSVLEVRGYRVSGSSALVNARKNGTLDHLGTDLSLTSANTWLTGGTPQNKNYAPGDSLEIMLVSMSANPTQIAIQVDFTRSLS